MDPDACLNEIRRLVDIAFSEGLDSAQEDELVDRIASLDRWLSSGGFLPKDWN